MQQSMLAQQQQPQQHNGCSSGPSSSDLLTAYDGAEEAIDAEIELLMALKQSSRQIMAQHGQALLQRLAAALLGGQHHQGAVIHNGLVDDSSPLTVPDQESLTAQLAALQAQGLVSCAPPAQPWLQNPQASPYSPQLNPNSMQLSPDSVLVGRDAAAAAAAGAAALPAHMGPCNRASIDIGALQRGFSSSQAQALSTDDFLRPLSCDSSMDALPALFDTPPNSLAPPFSSATAAIAAAVSAAGAGTAAGVAAATDLGLSSTSFSTSPLQANLTGELDLAALLGQLELQESSCMLGAAGLQRIGGLPPPPGLPGVAAASSSLMSPVQSVSYSCGSNQHCNIDCSRPLLLPGTFPMLAAGPQAQAYCALNSGCGNSRSAGLDWVLAAADPECTEQTLEAAQELLFPGARSGPLSLGSAVAAVAATGGAAAFTGAALSGPGHQAKMRRHSSHFAPVANELSPAGCGSGIASSGVQQQQQLSCVKVMPAGVAGVAAVMPPPPPPPPPPRPASAPAPPELATQSLRSDVGSSSSYSAGGSGGSRAAAAAAAEEAAPQAGRQHRSIDVHRSPQGLTRRSIECLNHAAPPKWAGSVSWDPLQDALKCGPASCKGTGVFMPRIAAAASSPSNTASSCSSSSQ